MAIPTNKQELINDIKKTYEKLRPEFDINSELASQKTMTGQIKDTKMSVHNLVSYLLGWGELMIEWNDFYQKNNKIPEIDTNYGELAEKFYQDYQEVDYQELVEKLDEVVDEIIKTLELRTNKELYEMVWYTTKSSNKDYTFGRLIQFNTSSPYKNARNRIRKWKKETK